MTTTFSVPLRSTGTAYLLWFFLGGFGAHQFYLGRPWRGIIYLVASMLAWLSLFGAGFVYCLPFVGMILWDLATMPSQVRKVNAKLKAEYEGF